MSAHGCPARSLSERPVLLAEHARSRWRGHASLVRHISGRPNMFPLHDVNCRPGDPSRASLTCSLFSGLPATVSGAQISASDRRLQSASAIGVWWSQTGSNRRPPACKAGALPAELWPQPTSHATRPARITPRRNMVGLGRLERPTSPLSGVRSNHLSYRPVAVVATRASSQCVRPERKRNEDGEVPP